MYKNIKVLIAEDSPDICRLYATAFMREGFVVYTAHDGEVAIEKFKAKDPDIVLLDIMMPEISGCGVLTEIRKKFDRYVPVIMLTNQGVEYFNRHQDLNNVDAYLIKSNFTPLEVVEKTKEVLKLNKIV